MKSYKTTIENNVISIEKKFILTDEDIKALKYIETNKFFEHRGKEPAFTQEVMGNLENIGLLVSDDMAWHLTWVLSDIGKEIVSQLK